MIVAQVRAVAEDIGVDAVKIGMLGDVGDDRGGRRGARPGRRGAGRPRPGDGRRERRRPARRRRRATALIERLLPRATVATPNLAEARELTGLGRGAPPRSELARAVHALGPAAVVVTGGHTEDGADLFFDGDGDPLRIEGRALPGRRRARLRLHPLLGAGRAASPRADAAARRRARPGPDRRGGGRRRAARDRRRRRPGRRARLAAARPVGHVP